MKKFILVLSVISILFLVGCNSNENVKDVNLSGNVENQQQGVINNDETLTFYERTKEFEKLKNEIKDSVILTTDHYDNGIQLAEKSIGDIVLEKQNDKYFLNISVLNAVSFEKEEIDAVVKSMKDNNLQTAKLGNFTISKNASTEQKEHLDFMKENDVVGIELDFWKEYTDTNWLDEDGIPVYIQSDIYEEDEYLWALKKVKEASSDRYYMFRIQIAGQEGLYSVFNPSNGSRMKIDLLATDKMNIKEYKFGIEEDYEFRLKNEKNTTIEEYFRENSEGKNSIVIDSHDIKMEKDTIYLEFYDNDVDDTSGEQINQQDEIELIPTFNVKDYEGSWMTLEDKNKNIEEDGGSSLTLKVKDNSIIDFEYTVISAAPYNRVAQINIENIKLDDNQSGAFTWEDAWYNKGKGTIKLDSDRVIISITDTQIDENAMWGIFDGKVIFSEKVN
ncbi:MAG: hypothetical protein J6C46_08995 [Clostridia bacterium]|nr:hypothetical protein [Clostridia bacterium]